MIYTEGQRRIYGVDFSGSKTACNKIWISEGIVNEGILDISACYPISKVVAGGAKDLDSCLLAMRSLIKGSGKGIFGMDFPFSLPHPLLFSGNNDSDWRSFITAFSGRYSSAEQFREDMRSLAPGSELKRLTDTEVKAPFCVYNLRLYRQTYFGIREVLSPLVTEDSARVLPMQEPASDKPWLIEVCPASTLKKEGLYIPYKGRSFRDSEAREYILEEMLDRGITLSPLIREAAHKNADGDALDSIIAAFAVSRAVKQLDLLRESLPQIYLTEGYTFF
ncbi:DUF429 domain-containing protein [Methanolobus chelungpuianus]|uniref:DUF429 domain-containing protein n=1 Tax=Methanolobus chelungpuianus TaxID=502115 RepID=A0AAE3KX20_9EURY|nr:DUF429 domain-containing protein [Methanolobus chelungpuianus]MCQ6962557.1 hypothetical protein [Methanolobus chelungpuianus]